MHCDPLDPNDAQQGDNWDHVCLGPGTPFWWLASSQASGPPRSTETLVNDFKERTVGRPMNLITSDEYAPYKTAILKAYGEELTPPRTGKPGRPQGPYYMPPPGLNYATVHKTRGKRPGGESRLPDSLRDGSRRGGSLGVVFGKQQDQHRIRRTSERDGPQPQRPQGKTYCFSKDWDVHEAVTYFTMYTYNFCWPVRTLRVRMPDGHWAPRSPAMTAGLTDHVWSLREWLGYPAVQRE